MTNSDTSPLRPLIWASELAVLAARWGDRTAVVDARGAVSYAELLAHAAGIGGALVRAGIRPGEAVATVFRNGREAAAAMFGTMMAGAVEVPLNPALGVADRRWALEVGGARLMLTTADLAEGLGDHGIPVLCVDQVPAGTLDPAVFPQARPEDDARIVFTSGTTGRPKGAVHTHLGRWTGNLLLRASLPHRPGPASRVLLMTPFSHGTSLMTFAYLSSGASVMLLDGVDPARVLGVLERGECDEMFAPPTVLAKIVAAAEGRRIGGLRTIFTGTAVLKPTLYEAAKAIFGPIVRVTYGKSEIFNPITVLEAEETDAWYGTGGGDACVGWPAPGVELDIRDEDGRSLPAGESGEVMIRGRHLMRGYRTAEGFRPLPPDGFHDTGDVGYLDGRGRLHLVGRMADVIKTGGYKVAPEEVERELAPALQPSEVAVLGLQSDYWGEVILAAVERPSEGWRERLEPVLATMTGYKRPRLLVALDELPRNGIGKIMRRDIREHVLSRYRLADGPRPALEPRDP
jgi:malonyl-CoA/methylmalonyl-CoA synthetase